MSKTLNEEFADSVISVYNKHLDNLSCVIDNRDVFKRSNFGSNIDLRAGIIALSILQVARARRKQEGAEISELAKIDLDEILRNTNIRDCLSSRGLAQDLFNIFTADIRNTKESLNSASYDVIDAKITDFANSLLEQFKSQHDKVREILSRYRANILILSDEEIMAIDGAKEFILGKSQQSDTNQPVVDGNATVTVEEETVNSSSMVNNVEKFVQLLTGESETTTGRVGFAAKIEQQEQGEIKTKFKYKLTELLADDGVKEFISGKSQQSNTNQPVVDGNAATKVEKEIADSISMVNNVKKFVQLLIGESETTTGRVGFAAKIEQQEQGEIKTKFKYKLTELLADLATKNNNFKEFISKTDNIAAKEQLVSGVMCQLYKSGELKDYGKFNHVGTEADIITRFVEAVVAVINRVFGDSKLYQDWSESRTKFEVHDNAIKGKIVEAVDKVKFDEIFKNIASSSKVQVNGK